ncbi:hypothetical protein EYZ11_002357 [Aspergillus tanneri]|uniref:DUF1308 domain-containing protein n=1 Tax=Aspergillus tanneri TaxID=1220188 RepID=A0A4S3JQV5_9EURO|nr:hypothetical protein EYZ11_002357 [Aspergillus tanneri]
MSQTTPLLPPCESPPETPQPLATSLVHRCQTLLSELDAFKTLLVQTQRNPQIVEVRSLRSNVLSELKTLDGLVERVLAVGDDPDDETQRALIHALRSSNLPFYETVWMIAKRTCSGLVTFGKRFYWGGEGGMEDGDGDGAKKRPSKDKRKSVYVDIVADDGEEWVKVSTVSETRLLFEMAKKGWEADSEAGSVEEGRTILQNFNGRQGGDEEGYGEEDEDDEIELVKLASEMRKAANSTRINYRHPRLRIVIPKIEEGESPEIDDLLKVIRSYGIVVDCGENALGCNSDKEEHPKPMTSLQEELRQLLPTPFKRFTSALNVDCTLLLALVSDLSHFKNIPPSPSYHRAILRQLEVESERPLLSTELWPAMNAHELVCTDEAAKRMREIVDVIGTDTEKKRAEIIMGDPPHSQRDPNSLIQDLQELSDYEIPPHWKLPIKTVHATSVIDSARQNGQLPPVSHQVTGILSDINYSVFMYGWAAGMTTISSNRTVVKQIETTVENHRNGNENLEGPSIWIIKTFSVHYKGTSP